MTNYDIIKIVNFLVNRDVNGRAFKQDEFITSINKNSAILFKNKLDNIKQHQKNSPVAVSGAEDSRKSIEDLRPFYVVSSLSATNGVATFPSNFSYLLALNPATITGRGFDELTANEIGDRLVDPVVQPTADDPVFVRQTGGESILVYPATLTDIVLYYYKKPADADFTLGTDPTTLLPTYTAVQELEWEDEQKVEIAMMVAKDAGVNLKDQAVVQDAVRTVTTGQ